MFLIQKTARLLIRPLCLIQPGCGFTARCRLAHLPITCVIFSFLWVRPLCIFALQFMFRLHLGIYLCQTYLLIRN